MQRYTLSGQRTLQNIITTTFINRKNIRRKILIPSYHGFPFAFQRIQYIYFFILL